MKSFIDFSWKGRWPYSVWSCNHGSKSSHWEKKWCCFYGRRWKWTLWAERFQPMIGSLRHFHLIGFDSEDGLCYCISHRKDVSGKRPHLVIGPHQHRELRDACVRRKPNPRWWQFPITGVRDTTECPRYVGTNCYLDKGPLHHWLYKGTLKHWKRAWT